MILHVQSDGVLHAANPQYRVLPPGTILRSVHVWCPIAGASGMAAIWRQGAGDFDRPDVAVISPVDAAGHGSSAHAQVDGPMDGAVYFGVTTLLVAGAIVHATFVFDCPTTVAIRRG